jgi:hypothetical protein
MEQAFPKIAGAHFFKRELRVVKRWAICKDYGSASVQEDDVLRYQINDPPQLVFVLMKLGLGADRVIDTDTGWTSAKVVSPRAIGESGGHL